MPAPAAGERRAQGEAGAGGRVSMLAPTSVLPITGAARWQAAGCCGRWASYERVAPPARASCSWGTQGKLGPRGAHEHEGRRAAQRQPGSRQLGRAAFDFSKTFFCVNDMVKCSTLARYNSANLIDMIVFISLMGGGLRLLSFSGGVCWPRPEAVACRRGRVSMHV